MGISQHPLNILIADDHQIITDGISKLIESEKIVGKIYTASNGREAVDQVLKWPIDCVIMDINMPVLNGLEATRLIKKEKPTIKLIVVSMQCDASIVNRMLKAGADAFINKDTGKEELMKAIHSVMKGEKYISPEISQTLFIHIADRNITHQDAKKHLTEREIEIIRYIADGFTNEEIAHKLFLSRVTVDTHRKNMLSKLELSNTAALVKYAALNKLLE